MQQAAVKNEKVELPVNADQELIDALVKIYNQKAPATFESYQEGMQAGIRYTLLALGAKIDGINSH